MDLKVGIGLLYPLYKNLTLHIVQNILYEYYDISLKISIGAVIMLHNIII